MRHVSTWDAPRLHFRKRSIGNETEIYGIGSTIVPSATDAGISLEFQYQTPLLFQNRQTAVPHEHQV